MLKGAYGVAAGIAKRKKFNKAADLAVTKTVEPLFDADGKRIITQDYQNRRIKAQMDSK